MRDREGEPREDGGPSWRTAWFARIWRRRRIEGQFQQDGSWNDEVERNFGECNGRPVEHREVCQGVETKPLHLNQIRLRRARFAGRRRFTKNCQVNLHALRTTAAMLRFGASGRPQTPRRVKQQGKTKNIISKQKETSGKQIPRHTVG